MLAMSQSQPGVLISTNGHFNPLKSIAEGLEI